MHRCFTGSTIAEDLALARLASSLEHSTFNAPMPVVIPSVQPVPHKHQGVGSSDKHQMHRCLGIGSTGATDFFTVSSILVSGTTVGAAIRALLRLFTSSVGSRNVHLTKVLISLIALLIDHQNHSKWHK